MFTINEEFETIIKNYFTEKKIQKIQTKAPKFLKEHPDIVVYLNEYLSNFPNWETIKKILYKIVLNIELPKCLNCGKEIQFSKRTAKYCSLKCCNSDETFLKNKENTYLAKYGVKNIQESEEMKKKIKLKLEKCLKNDPDYWKKRQEKTNNTKIKKYGSLTNAYLNAQNKRKQTSLNKYGNEFAFQNEQIKDKIKSTLITKYGSLDNYYNEIRKKRYENNFKKYGYYDKNIETSWKKIITKWNNYIIPMFSHEEYIGGNYCYKWKCVKCGNEFNQNIYSTGHLKEVDKYLPRCLKCFPMHLGISKKEIEVLNFCKIYFPNAKSNRSLIYPYEIDILIEEINLGIEFNGNWYHGNKSIEKPNYHLNKTLKCNKKGFRLIHIWEDEWDKNKESIKEKLIKIFENNEDLNFNDDKLILDRSWYNNIKFKSYELIDEMEPEMINRNGNYVENCGYLVYKRKN